MGNASVAITEDEIRPDGAIEPATLWAVISAMSGLWCFTFIAFITSAKNEYIHTFFTTMTGKQQLHRIFRNAKEDKEKMSVFKKHRSYWKDIEGEVRVFVAKNFYRWERERPEWWNNAMKARIPDDMLSATALQEEEAKGGGKRRRSSIREGMGLGSDGSSYVVPASE